MGPNVSPSCLSVVMKPMMPIDLQGRSKESSGQFPQQIDLLSATIRDLQGHLASGLSTSVQLVNEYLVSRYRKPIRQTGKRLIPKYQKRIEANNQSGLELGAVIEVAPAENVVQIAHRLDQMRAKGVRLTLSEWPYERDAHTTWFLRTQCILGKLHGIPLLVKDNTATDPILGM